MRRIDKVVVTGMLTAVMTLAIGQTAEAQRAPDRAERAEARAAARAAQAEARVALELARAELGRAGPALGSASAALAATGPSLGMASSALSMTGPALAAARAGLAQASAERSQVRVALPVGERFQTEPPSADIQDPADRLYTRAREALNRRRYEQAASLFEQIRDEFPRSSYVADSYYWEAFARFREGGARELREASDLLMAQSEAHPDAGTRRDAEALMVRIEAQLARRGDADAAAAIAQQASGPCDEDQEVRLAALSALLNMNAEQAVPILQEVLQSRDDCSIELRRRAVFLIAQHLTGESVDILLDLAHRNPDPDSEVREQAIFWLHQVPGPEALDALESILLESDDPQLQERAIFAISQRADDGRAIEILKDYAERGDIPNELRSNAIFWISQNPDAGGARYLIDLYPRLDDEELKERAIFGISQTASPEARSWLLERVRDQDESVEIRKNALFWVGQMGGLQASDFDGLYETLDDIEMKEQVIFVASQSGEPEAVDFLMEVARDEEDTELKQRAIFWLGQSNDPRVPAFLLTVIRG